MPVPKLSRPTPLTTVLFLCTWLAVGFSSGTVTLLGPVRWVTSAMRDGGASGVAERAAVLAIVAAYVSLSFIVTLMLVRGAVRRGGWRRVAVPVGAWLAAAACLWLWMTPRLVNGFQPVQIDTVARFTFGPYPERERFEQLREQGFTAVVSLLHPAVVPFEPTLLARERELAEEFGIEFIHAPMLPWVGDAVATIALLQELAGRQTGRYYVHCYLGRGHRTCSDRAGERHDARRLGGAVVDRSYVPHGPVRARPDHRGGRRCLPLPVSDRRGDARSPCRRHFRRRGVAPRSGQPGRQAVDRQGKADPVRLWRAVLAPTARPPRLSCWRTAADCCRSRR